MPDVTNQDILNAIRGMYQNTPNKVNDAAVLAKLGELEAKINAITSGATPAAVELTGSNVIHLGSDRNVAITAGSRTHLISTEVEEAFFSFLIRADSSHDYRIDIDWYVAIDSPAGTFSSAIYGESGVAESEGKIWMGKKVETLGNRARILLVNNDVEDHNYDIDMYGIRG